MEKCILVKDLGRYYGKYVATKNFLEKEVIAFGDDPLRVYNDAVLNGVDDPVIFFVPKKDIVHIYPCQ